MSALDFVELAKLINCSRTTTINLTPVKRGVHGWALYHGEYKVHLSSAKFEVLYLQADATRQDLETARKQAFTPKSTQVVYAPTLDQRQSLHRTLFMSDASRFWNSKEYLRSFLAEELNAYLAKLPKGKPDNYVDPSVRVPARVVKKLPNPLRSFLLDPDAGDGRNSGALAALLAEPGQGKTYMSHYLVGETSRTADSLVPLFIESQQWHNLSTEDQSSLWKVLTHCFRSYEAAIGWMEGHEDEFLRVSLKAGLFRIIFDGFDEYILKNRNRVNPQDALESLLALATESGTRIIVTSRTSFWNALFPENVGSGYAEGKAGEIYVYEIQPFDPQHARNYFTARLKKPELVETAFRVYDSLRAQSPGFAGRGFVLNLVADLFERGETHTIELCNSRKAALWLFEHMCTREQLRHTLPMSGAQQLSALSDFAVESMSGVAPDDALLRLCLEQAAEGIGEKDLSAVMDKLSVHPLIGPAGDAGDRWAFRHDAIGMNLLASRISEAPVDGFLSLADRLQLSVSQCSDLARTVIELVSLVGGDDAMRRYVSERALKVLAGAPGDLEAPYYRGSAARLVTSMLLAAVNKVTPKGSQRVERTQQLISLAGGKSLTGLVLSSVTADFDFSGVRFVRCVLDGNTWVNCEFSESTGFERCSFLGGFQPQHSRGFGLVSLVECRRDGEADKWISEEQIRAGKKVYGKDDLHRDIHDVLVKFVVRGGPALRTVSVENLNRGRTKHSKYGTEVLDAMSRHILEEHHVSGTSSQGINVREGAAECVRFYMQNNVMTGALKIAFDELVKKLKLV